MEVPFVAYGIPELTAATKRWTDEYRTEKLSPKALYKVHVAYDSHFMYYLTSKQLAGEKGTACKCLGLMIQGQSARHTSFNWSDTSALSEDARKCPAAEVALIAGEVLYLPSYWYHPWTLIQCNLRSGVAIRDDTKQFLSDCGFGPPK
ncbi:hypothetical protein PC121_g23464 [Phytophthora cactorum]|nr:hypothetical protein PC121_g23464 [Phytophthora cactorum]